MTFFSEEFITWLDEHADQIDKESCQAADQLVERIAAEGAYRVGVPEELGGSGGNDADVIEVLKELARHSLTASFISWGQRTFIDNIIKSDNPYFREHYLEGLLSGEYAGATGLSNAVKFLSDLEELNVSIVEEEGQLYLQGRLPWVTNARSDRFISVFAADFEKGGRKPLVIAVPSDAENFSRSADLEFVSLQGGNTASLTFNRVPLKEEWVLAQDAQAFLAQNRPAFLGYQFGLALGLAERSLAEVEANLSVRSVLREEWEEQLDALTAIQEALYSGLLKEGYFVQHPRELFQLRIDIVDVVAQSLLLELQAGGGRGYFSNSTSGFIRRWNEGAFLPIVSPSAVQLRHILEVS
ncbi:acyl-CoA dehydrogenase family protein [Streptococcus panodentis]|uniref:Dehydrogenase n=1 Tax=Streptococcus panodentis TaxID=1581472 RepID=A0ABS5AXS8_9STRE|nr:MULTISPECIES: acyl-CoA dehydrogenase family protein [Streptococcus]KXT84868.1 Butyryl-CoA dehydrogenase [Streptococcus sp. DD11]MBP2621388.1 dehydrogenase [Streptococcus panodentis]